jgi:ABC-type arginine transport system ATPase subunit
MEVDRHNRGIHDAKQRVEDAPRFDIGAAAGEAEYSSPEAHERRPWLRPSGDAGEAQDHLNDGILWTNHDLRAVMWNSKLVIPDEPTAALGVAQAQQVLELVRRLADQGPCCHADHP